MWSGYLHSPRHLYIIKTRMAQAPWSENELKVVVEFQKSSTKGEQLLQVYKLLLWPPLTEPAHCIAGPGRKIVLKHSAKALPPQLYGRVSPEAWAAFMTDVEQLALSHPYTAPPTAACCCKNIGGLFCCECWGC